MKKKTMKQRLVEAIGTRKVIEVIYRLDDGSEFYFAVVPVGIFEHDGRCYLLAIDRNNDGYAFDVARIVTVDDYWADFSLCKEFDTGALENALFNKGKYIDGYIMVTSEKANNPEKLRMELQGIEAEIKAIVGAPKESDWVEAPVETDREKLKELLRARRWCLNMMFRKDPHGRERFAAANNRLRELTDLMYRKGAKVYRQYLAAGVDGEFDDDFMIDASLRFVYNSGDSVAVLGDEAYYGSDFGYMINVIYDLCADSPLAGASFSKGFRKTDRPEMSDRELELDNDNDAFDWSELKITVPELEGIKICNAVNAMCVYDNGYSVPDLLRMNDFWCEVKAIYQHIYNQNKKRPG